MKQTPLKRKVSLRDGYLRKLKEKGTHYLWQRNGKMKKKRPLKKLSRSHRSRLQVYYARSTEFLLREENQVCQICTRRREAGENIPLQTATEIHHFAGRIGRLLCYVPYFIASCYGCRMWPHDNKEQARAMRLLAPMGKWNVYPEN